MRTGLVRKILDYYFTTEAFRCETERAFKEFFDLKDISLLAKIKMTDAKSNHFNEWFLYDFRLRNNKSSLENFCETDPENWDDEDIKAAKDLLINEYGAYEVLEIEPGTGLKIQNLQFILAEQVDFVASATRSLRFAGHNLLEDRAHLLNIRLKTFTLKYLN